MVYTLELGEFGQGNCPQTKFNLLIQASIPKVVGSNPTVARHIFQACPVWIYTQSNITQASY